jgi:glutamate dehydrogenase
MRSEEVLKAEEVDKVAAEIRARLGGAGAAAEAFARRYYAQVPPEDVRERRRTELVGAALSLWTLGQERRPGEARVRVFNPQLADHGWQCEHTVVEVVNDDMPFLVDSVTAELGQRELAVLLVVHPVVKVRRDGDGRLQAVVDDEDGAGAVCESFMHVEVERIHEGGRLEALHEALLEVLAKVRAAVEDWPPMRQQLMAIIGGLESSPPPLPAAEIGEAVEFLRWLDEDHFTFLGYREYELAQTEGHYYLEPREATGVGILRHGFRAYPPRARELTPEMVRFARQPQLVIVTKSDSRSKVHRAVHMDYVAVKRIDAAGEVVGEQRFLGLFTSLSYSRRAGAVPLLRRKVERVLERAGFDPRSHDGKALLHILETFPRDELFQIDEDQLLATSLGILQLQERRRLALFVRKDNFERFISCMVYVPRDRFNTTLRHKMEKILEKAFNGILGATYTQVSDEPLARLQFYLKTEPGAVPEYDVEAIETALAEAARTWSDDLQRVLVEERGEERGLVLFRRYAEAFPTAYREVFRPLAGTFDIDRIEEALAGGELGINLYRPMGAGVRQVRVKLYRAGDPLALSAMVPLFENLGFEVVAEMPYEVRPAAAAAPVWIRDFELAARDVDGVDPGEVRQRVEETLSRVWRGEVESDTFNRLVLTAGLDWRQVTVLRAYCRYLRQTGVAFSQAYMAQTLVNNPEVARLLVALFAARFDPDGGDGEAEREAEIKAATRRALDAVANLDEDRILRRYFNLVRATLRTNYFQTTAGGGPKPYLSFKLDSPKVHNLPRPRARLWIFVYSPRVEALHLRGGLVARGGIRWSDRPEDFRTEILGLLKAQMVKNAVIVPVGAKGGFVVKRPPPGRQALAEEGVECYRTLIRGLLDLTDNYQGHTVVPPPRVVRRDGDDPYLVVAADKGTATFSDVANAIAAEYGFWLGDAFASGGSAGYDHKTMAITARGAWESVKRHFRELGTDVQSQDFTVVGVGDMSGDVFGNGMLLSRHVKLLGAFNHLDVFVDPDPDPAASWAERQRLFELPRSSWRDYDPGLISAGGGVFDRSAKAIEVTPEMRSLFGLDRDQVTPGQLIQALLRAPVDLLWFGGIGTFVKAAAESGTGVGDRANDGVRVDAAELRSKVVGEGANLGVTQRGRIEYALAGGRINTDAIDNSGGVDTSDHEVNIKILLDEAVAAGDLTGKQRDELLEEMTDEVAALVLRDNYQQTQAITVAQSQGVTALDRQARLIRELERAGRLDRALEALPDDESLSERQAAGGGLTRPELAILLAYSKISLYEELLASDLPDDPMRAEDLVLYFPRPLRKRFAERIRRHRLRREIVATHVTNSMVNRVGPTFVYRLASATGAGASEVARAYAAARDAFEVRGVWTAIEALDNRVAADLQVAMILATEELVERGTRWLLRHRFHDSPRLHAALRPGIATLAAALAELLPGSDLAALRRRQKRFERNGVPRELATRMAGLEPLGSAPEIIRIAGAGERGVEEVGRVYFAAGARFGFDWLRASAARLKIETPWQREAVAALVDELFAQQGEVTVAVLAGSDPGAAAKAAIEAWTATRAGLAARTRDLLADLRAGGALDLAMLSVARHQLGELLAE